MIQMRVTSARRYRWLERLIALLSLLNLCLIFFDLSYLPLRDFYLQSVPAIIQYYDPIKGIQPHPETQLYLERVDQLETQLAEAGLQSPQTENLLKEMQQLSLQMMADDPFAVAGKSSTLAKIEQELRHRTNTPLARDAFTSFWSPAYLAEQGWQSEIAFFNTELRPLMDANFYRDVNSYGRFIDRFWQIDLPFMLIFAADFLIRTLHISRRRPDLTWIEAMLRRWYDLFLLLPFWRWLRVLPVTIRLYQADLLNLEPVRAQVNHDFAISFAQELTELVGIQVIDQMQESIQRGDVMRWLLHPEVRRPYVQVNEANEVRAIATRLVNVSVYDVLPKIQSDVEDLVHHVMVNTLNQSSAFRQIQNIPGLGQLPSQLIERLAKDLSQTAYQNLITVLEDPVAAELINRLIKNFRDVLETELQKKHNVQEIQTLLVDMLEEIKINYIKQIAQNGTEKVIEEVEQLHRLHRT